ncbi:unnamed protein product [Phytophthora lilii]|uniref:Unnamed protein product n=1 Tax=Phytophthora lilii TaxID=2077276 RepID=A0A9W6TZM5_9STRA|nr:unnamed protein product [Phytophthora lilii]
MWTFIRSNGEQCKLARNKERCGKHPIIMDKETIVVESNIVEEVPPQVNTPVVAEVVDTPAPSVIEPVEASNVEVSKVPELDESNVEPVATDSAVYKEEYNSDSEKLYNSNDEYDSDNEDEVIPAKTKLNSPQCGFVHDDSWMCESSDDDSSDDDSIVWDESNNQIPDESYLEEFETEEQAEAYAEYSVPAEEEVTSATITPTKKQLRLWLFLILASNYHENQDRAEAEKLVLDMQQIACLRKYVEEETRNDSKVKDMDAELKRQS